ncbi:hypothetical protein GQ53DRAFT_745400 [Thozetella sp. PMI_491]|nr:hypothetical protein GQ53DRAFT_745400 [Thozetella sp. PMI_491]
MAPPAVTSRKQAFIASQTRLLEKPLEPSREWQRSNQNAEEGFSDRLLTEVFFKLNHKLQQHEHRVHPQQATRHVAEQIDALYWNAAERMTGREESGRDLPESLSMFADLTDPQTIATLPPAWASEREIEAYPAEAQRYEDLAAALLVHSTRKQETSERLARLRAMHKMLRPFETEVQPNLVTRGGGVETELERQKLLLARVGGRIDRLPDAAEDEGEGAGTDTEGRRHPGHGQAPGPDDMLVDEFYVDEQVKSYQLLNMF